MKIFQLTGLVISTLAVGGCNSPSTSNQDHEVLNREKIVCAAPGRLEMRPWGEVGQSAGCYVQDGAFVTAEGGYIRLRGQFTDGKKSGIWRWYDPQGKVIKEIDYSPNG